MDSQKEREAFQPKIGEKYWHISPHSECGYAASFWSASPADQFASQFSVYRTKAEIKPIIALIRKITRNQESFVLVPRDPTEEMLRAAWEAPPAGGPSGNRRVFYEKQAVVYKAMIEATEGE